MPIIPTFEAQPDAQRVQMPGADPGAFAAPGNALSGAGGQLGGFGAEWEQRYAAAKQQADAANLAAAASKQADELRRQASLIPDHRAALAQFNDGYAKLQAATLKQSDDPLVQSYVSQHMATQGAIFGAQVGNEAFQREASAQAATNDQNKLDALNRIATNPDPIARAHEIDAYSGATQGLAAGGFITNEDAQRRITDFRFRISQDDVMRDAAKSPSLTYAKLSDPAQRAVAYPYLPPEWADHFALRLEGRAAMERGRAAGTLALGGVPTPSGDGTGPMQPGALGVPSSYAPIIDAAVAGTPVPARLVGAVAQHESGWDPGLTGTAGEIGLGQIKPSTAAEPGYGVAPVDPATLKDPAANLGFTAQYLAGLGRHFGVTDWSNPDQVRPVLEAYNASGHKVDYATGVLTLAGMNPAKAPADAPDEEAALKRADALTQGDPLAQAHAESEVRKRISEWRTATQADRAQLDHQLGDLSDALTQGVQADIPVDRIRALYPPQVAQEKLQDLGVRSAIGTLTSSLRYASPDELASTVQSLDSGMGTAATLLNLKLQKLGIQMPAFGTDEATTANYRIRQAALGVLRQVIAARSDGLAHDPAGYVAQEPTVQAAANALDDKDPATFERYARATQAVQQRLGVSDGDTRVLPAAQSRAIAGQLLATDPVTGDAGGAIDGLASKYGAAWPDVWHDLVRDGKLPAEWQVLGSMPPGSDRMALQRALQASAKKGGADAMRADIDPALAQTIDKNLDSSLGDFRRTVMIPQLQGDVGVLSAVRGAAKQLAYWKVLNGETDGNAAVQDAVAAVAPYDIEGLARAPKGQGALASTVAATVLNGLTPDSLAPAAGGQGMRDTDRQQAYVDALKRSGQWVTNERGDGWVLAVRGSDGGWQFPRDDRGQRVGFRFSQMANMQRQAPPDSVAMPDLGGPMP